MYFPISSQSRGFLILSVSMIACLLLLINLSFKIIAAAGLVFTTSSLLCSMITGIYLLALRNLSFEEQRHLLNISLIALYVFSIGIYILVHLPAAQDMNNNPVYQIVFEDIPKKFFATTFAFGVSFYLPHNLYWRKPNKNAFTVRASMLLALFGGISFFAIDFYFLFSELNLFHFKQIFIDSLLINIGFLLVFAVSYLGYACVSKKQLTRTPRRQHTPVFHYLVCIAIMVLLVCLSCEYQLVTLFQSWTMSGNSLLFPVILIVGTLAAEIFGYRASVFFTAVLIMAQLFFDALFMLAIALPSPAFFDLNPFYHLILPRRIPAATLALLLILLSNGYLLHRLRAFSWFQYRWVRIMTANLCATVILCVVSYSLLFSGFYNFDQMFLLAVNALVYKIIFTLVTLPFIVLLCNMIERRLQFEYQEKQIPIDNKILNI